MKTEQGFSSESLTERRFFLGTAIIIFIIVIVGFGSDIVVQHVWFTDFPWPVHIHAVVFSSWILLYVVQNHLIVNGNIDLHRRLGWLGASIATLMVPLGIVGTMMAIARGSVTGLFPLGLFLAMNVLGIVGFGILTFAAIRLRSSVGWHKRLMLSGTVLLIGPAIARIANSLSFGEFVPLAVGGAMLMFFVSGIAFDRMTLRRVHPAYWWGLGLVAIVQILIGPVGFSPPVVAFATQLAK